MRRKFLLLLETGLVLAGLLLGASAWKLHSALEQPLNLSQEQLLDVPAGPAVGAALDFMMEIRLEEGILGEEVITQRLREWWSANAESVMKTKRTGRRRSE